MKYFTIQTPEQADALRPYSNTPKFALKMGHIITPSAGVVERAYWDSYPESDALTFEQCMDILADRVTEEVMRELGDVIDGVHLSTVHITDEFHICRWSDGVVDLGVTSGAGENKAEIPNPTGTKIRLLTKILRGQ